MSEQSLPLDDQPTRLGRAADRLLGTFENHPLLRRLVGVFLPAQGDALPGEELLGSRLTIRLLALLLGALLLWSALFTLDIASHSTGEVASMGQTKLVQHLEGGIVRRILVREGQRVAAGEPLAEVERVSTLSEGRETEALLSSLRIRALRLEAQLAGADEMQVPEELAKDYPEQVKVNRDLFVAQKSRLGSRYEEQQQKILQRDAEEKELKARSAHLSAKLKLLRQQIAISEKLMKEGLANRYEHLELLKDEEQLRGTLQETQASLGRVLAAQRQEQAALTSLDSGGNEELQKELAEARRQITELQERLRKFSDSRERQVVRSPIEGVVMTLQVVTEGGVIQPGGTLMTLVPADEPLTIETRLPVGDIGMVNLGQQARIQLVSSIARGFQPIDGEVVDISPDSVLDEQKVPYYRVRIRPAQDAFVHRGTRYPLLPGVPVSVAILTGERSLFNYIAGPLTDGMHRSFSEP